MNYSLSDKDIRRLLHDNTNVVTYEMLANVQSIEQLLAKGGNAVVLYPGAGPGIGHWTCVLYTVNDRGKRVIEFFDPYGMSVDAEFGMAHKQLPRYMARLLYNTPYQIEYNDKPIQIMAADVTTCGRHCVNRIRNANLPLSEYIRRFGTGYGATADEIVTVLIN